MEGIRKPSRADLIMLFCVQVNFQGDQIGSGDN